MRRPQAARACRALLGYAGRLTDEKGLHVLMSAVERIDPSLEWSLLVMGSGPMKSDIVRWAKERHFATRIDIRLLTHEEIPRYLPVVDVLLVPSQTRAHWKEQFGRVIVEAFACAVPVITSDSGEIPFVAGDAAKVLPESDTALWAATIESALRDPDSLRSYVERGLERCEQFSVVTTASRLGAVFRRMIARRSAR